MGASTELSNTAYFSPILISSEINMFVTKSLFILQIISKGWNSKIGITKIHFKGYYHLKRLHRFSSSYI